MADNVPSPEGTPPPSSSPPAKPVPSPESGTPPGTPDKKRMTGKIVVMLSSVAKPAPISPEENLLAPDAPKPAPLPAPAAQPPTLAGQARIQAPPPVPVARTPEGGLPKQGGVSNAPAVSKSGSLPRLNAPSATPITMPPVVKAPPLDTPPPAPGTPSVRKSQRINLANAPAAPEAPSSPRISQRLNPPPGIKKSQPLQPTVVTSTAPTPKAVEPTSPAALPATPAEPVSPKSAPLPAAAKISQRLDAAKVPQAPEVPQNPRISQRLNPVVVKSPPAPAPAKQSQRLDPGAKKPMPIVLGKTTETKPSADDSIFAPVDPKPEPVEHPVGWKQLEPGELPSGGVEGLEVFSRDKNSSASSQPAEVKPQEASGQITALPPVGAPPPAAGVQPVVVLSAPTEITAKATTPPPLPEKKPVTPPPLPKPADKAAVHVAPPPLESAPADKPKRLPPPLPIAVAKVAPAPVEKPVEKAPAAAPVHVVPPQLEKTAQPAAEKLRQPQLPGEPRKPEPTITVGQTTTPALNLKATPPASTPATPQPSLPAATPAPAPAQPASQEKKVPVFLFAPAAKPKKIEITKPLSEAKGVVPGAASPTIKVEDAKPAETKPALRPAVLSDRTASKATEPTISATPAKIDPKAPATTARPTTVPGAPAKPALPAATGRPTTVPGAPAKPALPPQPAPATPSAKSASAPATPAKVAESKPISPAGPNAKSSLPTTPAKAPEPIKVVMPATAAALGASAKAATPPSLPATSVSAKTPEPAKSAPPALPSQKTAASSIAYPAPAAAKATSPSSLPAKAPEPARPVTPVSTPAAKPAAKPSSAPSGGTPAPAVPGALAAAAHKLPGAGAVGQPVTLPGQKKEEPHVIHTVPASKEAGAKHVLAPPSTPLTKPKPAVPAPDSTAAPEQTPRAARVKKKRLIEAVVFYVAFIAILVLLYFGGMYYSHETRVEGQVIPPAGMTLANEAWIVGNFRELANGIAEDLAAERAPKMQEIQEKLEHVQRAQADIASREERIRLYQEQIAAAKADIAADIKQAREAAQKIWDGPGAALEDDYNTKLLQLQHLIADRAKSLNLKYAPDDSYRSPEVWANAYRLALYEVPQGVDGTKEHLWIEDQLKQWRVFTKSLDDQQKQLREQAAQIQLAPTAKVAEVNAKIEDLQHRIDATVAEEEPIKTELLQAQNDLAQEQSTEENLDDKYYKQLDALPEGSITKRLPIQPNGRFSWRNVEKDSLFSEGEKAHHYYLFVRAYRQDGRQYWALHRFSVGKNNTVEITIEPGAFLSTKAILRPDLPPDEQEK